jgi:hypothetical protein
MRNFIFLLVLVCLTSVEIFAGIPQSDRRRGSDDQPIIAYEPEGIVYSLPRTGFVVEIKASKTVYVPGPYAQYAKKYLGIENAVEKTKVNWRMTGVNVERFFEADPDAMFKAMDTIASRVSLIPGGVISGINTGPGGYPDPVIGNDFIISNDALEYVFTDLSSDDFYYILVDGETGDEIFEQKTLEEKAREAADYIIRLRKKRSYAILDPSDVIPEDGKGYEVFVNEAKRLDEKYMELFTGKRIDSEHIFNFVFVPGNENVRNEVLFRFSDERGILPKSDMSGRPVFISLTKEQQAFDKAKRFKESENPDAAKSNVFYRVPVSASIAITEGVNAIYTGKSIVAQFGIVAPLPEKFLDGKYKVEYNTETGAIKNISEVE